MTTSIRERKGSAGSQRSNGAEAWLGLAASPTFALMAWVSTDDMRAMLCASGPGLLPIGGMAWMYLLMSLFHLSPWLKLASARSQPRNTTPTQTEGD